MGYDMYQVIEPPLATQYEKERSEALAAARAEVERLKNLGEDGSWTTPSENERLSTEEIEELTTTRARKAVETAREEWIKDQEGPGWLERAELLKPVQPTQAMRDATKVADDLMFSTAHHQPYFRLNIFGMGKYFTAMASLGMIKESSIPDEWPTTPSALHDDELRDHLDMVWGGPGPEVLRLSHREVQDRLRERLDEARKSDPSAPEASGTVVKQFTSFLRAQVAHLAAHTAEDRGIEARKFGSNDGWIVTKEECQDVVDIWSNEVDDATKESFVETLGDYWLLWMEFIANGAAGDGFTVH